MHMIKVGLTIALTLTGANGVLAGREPAINRDSQLALKDGRAGMPRIPERELRSSDHPTSWAEQKKRDNEAIQEAQRKQKEEERFTKQVDAIVEALTTDPKDVPTMKAEEITKALLDASGYCSVCEMERNSDREYFTRLVLAAEEKFRQVRVEQRRKEIWGKAEELKHLMDEGERKLTQ